MKFPKDIMQELAYMEVGEKFDFDGKEIEIKVMESTGNSRWSQHFYMVFAYDNRFFCSNFSKGATEYQDEAAYEYEKGDIDCDQVFPHKVETIEYRLATGETVAS